MPDLNDPNVVAYLRENGFVKDNTDPNCGNVYKHRIILRDGVKRKLHWGFAANQCVSQTMLQLGQQFDVKNTVHLSILVYALCLKDMEDKIKDAVEVGEEDPRKHLLEFSEFAEILPQDAEGLTDLFIAAVNCFSEQAPDELIESGRKYEEYKNKTAAKRTEIEEQYDFVASNYEKKEAVKERKREPVFLRDEELNQKKSIDMFKGSTAQRMFQNHPNR